MSITLDDAKSHPTPPHSECLLCGQDYPFRLPPAIIDAASNGRLVIFAGGGISTERPGFFPSSLHEEMESVLSSPPEDRSFPSIMSSYESEFGRLKLVSEIIERINYAKSFPSLRVMVMRFHDELATIAQISEVITTNWDDYFERYCAMQPIVNDQDYVFYNLPGRKVYKIHGSISNVSTIVATLDDYRRCEERLKTSVIGGTLRHLLGTKIVVFLGYSLQDEDFKNVYGPLIEGMDALRPVTYVVSPFDVPDADDFKLRHIKTDGSTFLRSLKEHLISMGESLPDKISERIDSLCAIVAECHAKTSAMDWRSHPELFYSLSYQDGLLDGFGRIMTQFNTGEFTYIPHIQHIAASYDGLLRTAVEKHRYWDAAYIDGYCNALICLLLQNSEVSTLPLYEVFAEDTFPPEVDDMPGASSEDTREQDAVEAERTKDTEEETREGEPEEKQFPSMLSQDELLSMLAGMEGKYPKLFEEARRIISDLPAGSIFQHTVFLDGVIGEYSPPSIT
jgi:SIR2-like domain